MPSNWHSEIPPESSEARLMNAMSPMSLSASV